ncbi:PucR family transcriptional regulator ligand-binding domain-containing protein [Streptomyces sp. NBC_01261]|uniref:PucR family transcriptional regulator ligand-binding domain-containing protein n=1 Tax=Streptomyces sp. NBC_01261 TaxID=2903802 RepID=UPI002E36C241|nr:PucR family transcriptional regulator ligand-binding domain-containing protein [Streptomyces sp. NBC_01261]
MPDLTVPPTPPVLLSALLAREDLGLRQIAGPSDPDIAIHWAHTSEMPDPYPYLLGGELLLTAGVHIPDAAGSDGGPPGRAKPELGEYFDDYVARIVEAGGVALGFGVAPVHDTVPRALVAACDHYDLPLLEVPPPTPFSRVARAVWQLMAQARLAELRRVTEAQQSLAAAASRPDPVPSVLRQLAQRVSGRAVLFGPDGTEIAAAGRAVGATGPEAGRRAASTGSEAGRRAASTGAEAGRRAASTGAESEREAGSTGAEAGREAGAAGAQAGHGAGAAGAQASGAEVREALAELARVVRPPAARIASPTASPTSPVSSPTSPTFASTDSAPPNRPAPTPTSATDTVPGAHLATYALGTGQGFVLGVAAPQRAPGDHTIASVAAVLLSLLTGEHQSRTGADRSSALVRLLLGAPPEDVASLLGGDRWVVVHAAPDAGTATAHTPTPDPVAASALAAALGSTLLDLAPDVVRVLVPADREPAPQPGWTLGVSAAVTPEAWPAADTQASRALARARATRTPLVRHGSAGRAGLAELLPHGEAEAHARTLLAPLAAHPALTDTLRTWLSLHGSWDRTAVALAVHRNTVRQRIARCAALLETDLDDPDVRMELWFGLRHL